jgi:glycosyltransferase involved in cell wall biosynthesis
MKIALYALCYNETFMLPFFMRYYRPLVDRIIINDNESTDGSRELALSLGADEVRTFSTNRQIRDDLTQILRNNCWKELKGRGYDWIFIVDMDEFIHHADLHKHLARCDDCGVTICIPQGFQMVGTALPTYEKSLFDQIRTGFPATRFSKPIIFKPDAIVDMNFGPGSHFADPEGVASPDVAAGLRLLHYHWLSFQWVDTNNKWRARRLSAQNLAYGWGKEYKAGRTITRKTHERLLGRCIDVFKYVEPASDAWLTRRRLRIRGQHPNENREYLEAQGFR